MFSSGEIVTYNNEQCVITEIIPGFVKITPIIYNGSKKTCFVQCFETEEDCINSIALEIINMFRNGTLDGILHKGRCKDAQEKIFKKLPKDVKNAILSYNINKELDCLQESIEKYSNKVELLKTQLNQIIGDQNS